MPAQTSALTGAVTPRTFATFQEALSAAYEEEISGATFFATLGRQLGGAAEEALALFAEIEQETQRLVAPVARAHGLPKTSQADLNAEGAAEAESLRGITWAEFLAHIVADYPAYVAEFEATRDLAAPEARATLQWLVDHEVAMLDFARAELAGDANSRRVLRDFLAKARAAG
ncbi:MAG: hypothetical protein WBA91_06775 [Paracoccaceae bacterium]